MGPYLKLGFLVPETARVSFSSASYGKGEVLYMECCTSVGDREHCGDNKDKKKLNFRRRLAREVK